MHEYTVTKKSIKAHLLIFHISQLLRFLPIIYSTSNQILTLLTSNLFQNISIMEPANSLPPEIINAIFVFVAPEYRSTLSRWSQSLGFLAICHSWRVATYDFVYSCVFCETIEMHSPTLNDTEPRASCIKSNFGLVRRYTALRFVNQLNIRDYNSYNRITLLFDIMNELGINAPIHECGMLQSYFAMQKWHIKYTEALKYACHAIVKAVAFNLVVILPNITRLKIESNTADNVMVDFLAEIACLFRHKLLKFECFTGGYLPQLLEAEKLRYLHLSLSNWQFIPKKSIYPSSLEYLCLKTDNVKFAWNIFRISNSCQTVHFDNLRSLNLYGDIKEYPQSVLEDEGKLDINFPVLEYTDIRYIQLAPKHIKSIMCKPLKRLRYSGYSSDALHIAKQEHANLVELALNFERSLEPDHAKFIRQSNEIFSKTRNIDTVRCNIFWGPDRFEFYDIRWPFVTHLEVHARFELCSLLNAVRSMTHLVSLFIDMGHVSKRNVRRAINWLEDKRPTLPAKIPCKIQLVMLNHGIRYRHTASIKPAQQDWFVVAESILINA